MWSKEKKLLESRLANNLINKIEYVFEGGRKTTWQATYKVEIRYNKKLIVSFSEGINYMTLYYESIERRKIEKIQWTKEESYELFKIAQNKLWNEEIYTTDIFFIGMKAYLSMSIDDALKSEQWMIRLFAILDKRCGKRRLIKMKDEIKSYPTKLKELYYIRLKEEGIEMRWNVWFVERNLKDLEIIQVLLNVKFVAMNAMII